MAKAQFPHGVLALWQIHTCAHIVRGANEREIRGKWTERKKALFILAGVKLRFNFMWFGYKTGGVSDNKCVAGSG